MRKFVSITVGFIAVMLLICTHLAWNYMVLVLLHSINSGEYCKEKCIFTKAASNFSSKKLSLQYYCFGND